MSRQPAFTLWHGILLTAFSQVYCENFEQKTEQKDLKAYSLQE
jgi:hypothetical protein